MAAVIGAVVGGIAVMALILMVVALAVRARNRRRVSSPENSKSLSWESINIRTATSEAEAEEGQGIADTNVDASEARDRFDMAMPAAKTATSKKKTFLKSSSKKVKVTPIKEHQQEQQQQQQQQQQPKSDTMKNLPSIAARKEALAHVRSHAKERGTWEYVVVKPWCRPDLTWSEAENFLHSSPVGAFIVYGKSPKLAVRSAGDAVLHFEIKYDPSQPIFKVQLVLGRGYSEPFFSSIETLVQHYEQTHDHVPFALMQNPPVYPRPPKKQSLQQQQQEQPEDQPITRLPSRRTHESLKSLERKNSNEV
jgi:hypothetical protein